MKITVNGKGYSAEIGENLSDVLLRNRILLSHPCGGKGTCGKCLVLINGKTEKACQYTLKEPVSVSLQKEEPIQSFSGTESSRTTASDTELVLDIGTTTLALAAVSPSQKKILKTVTENNPQRIFGADVISRIEYAQKNGHAELTEILRKKLRDMTVQLDIPHTGLLHVAGNTTMLHLLSGIDPTPMGVSPYTPGFLEEKWMDSMIPGIKTIHLLPGISAFVGADLVAGLNYTGLPAEKYFILVDLGTNAEIILYSHDKIMATASAAGPCFEGANISCGMPALPGAICSYSDGKAKTVKNRPPKGICGTGLVDIVAYLLEKGIMDETGFLEDDFRISETVTLTQEDVRQYQLAKSAVNSGILTLIHEQGISFDDIEHLYISGGFAAQIDVKNATRTGLLPEELKDRCVSVGNSSLLGAVKWVFEKNNLSHLVQMATYTDLAKSKFFSDTFMENMMF